MRVLLVAPGHAFSTIDVYHGLHDGLRTNGITVYAYPLHETLETMDLMVGAARLMNISPAYPDVFQLASMGIPGAAMAKQVEAAIFIHGLNVPASIPATLKRGGIRTVLVCTESPYQIEEEKTIAPFFDIIFTNDRAAPRLFSNNRPDTVHYLPHAYNAQRHTRTGEMAAPCDVFFCGTRFPERAALLDGVDWTGIEYVEKSIDYNSGRPAAELLPKITSNADVAAHYRSATISICHHRADPTGTAESLNPRCYEVPACGGFLISDVRAELWDVFGDAVPTYTDSASLERVIRYFLSHPQERDALRARQLAAVAPHTWAERARHLLGILARHTTEALV